MSWTDYKILGTVPTEKDLNRKLKYSITSDILSYQLCRRQYGFFAVRGYQPAHIVQYWFGTVIHQVLDKLHLHYSGLIDPKTKNHLPTDENVETYFNSVEESLRARGISAINIHVRNTAIDVLKTFNRIEGPKLYPNVKDTECELQSDQGDYILHGIVDVLKDVSADKPIKGYDNVEIWDYKGSKFPDITTEAGLIYLNRYKFQMLVYAELYKLKYGKYPLKGKLYFMDELKDSSHLTETPSEAIYVIEFRDMRNLEDITDAMTQFSSVVDEIEHCREYDQWAPPEKTEKPPQDTCDICDLRWDCDAVHGKYPMRYP